MKIFDKRPLALILCVMLGSFVFFTQSSDATKIVIPVIGVLLFILSYFIFKEEKGKRILLRICCVALMIATLASHIYFDLYYLAYKRFDTDVEIVGTVEEINIEGYPKTLTVKSDSVNDAPMSKYRILVYIDAEQSVNLSVGSTVRIIGRFDNSEGFSSNNTDMYYISKGISATISDSSDIELLSVNDFSFDYKLTAYRSSLTRDMICDSDTESGGLLGALLLGDKTYLSKQTAMDFERVGISHVLALSGMHLVILTFAVGKLLSVFKLNKKVKKVFEILFVFLYMLLTGFSSSVVRSGLMLIVSSLLFLFSRKSDSVTNLVISVFIICLINPCSAFDTSLQLSALATLGIIVLSELEKRKPGTVERKGFFKKVLFALKTMVLSSVFAIGATIMITAFNFGTISLWPVIVTPIVSFMAEILMYLGMLLLLFGDIWFLGDITQVLGDAIAEVVEWFSSVECTFLSTDFLIVEALAIIFSVVFFGFILIEFIHKRLGVLLICVLFILVNFSAYFSTVALLDDVKFEYLCSEKDEILFMQSEENLLLVDMSDTDKSSSYNSIGYITERKFTEIDSYIFTNYHNSLPEAVNVLLSSIKIDKLYVPSPLTKEESVICDELKDIDKNFRCDIIFYSLDHVFYEGDFNIYPFYRSQNNKVAFTVKYNDEFYSYLSSGMLEGKEKAAAFSLIKGCHTLILGSHGSSYSNLRFIYEIDGIDTLILSSDNVKIPDDTYEFYKKENTKVYIKPDQRNLIR